jgi:hypothetical protein
MSAKNLPMVDPQWLKPGADRTKEDGNVFDAPRFSPYQPGSPSLHSAPGQARGSFTQTKSRVYQIGAFVNVFLIHNNGDLYL